MADEVKKFLDADGLEHVLEEVKEWCEEDRVAITNAVILQEKESQQVIHNFTKTHYVDGNNIGYGGVGNSIVCDGYLIGGEAKEEPSSWYSSINFPMAKRLIFSDVKETVYNLSIYCRVTQIVNDRADFVIAASIDGEEVESYGPYASYSGFGITPVFEQVIMPPDSEFTFGAADVDFQAAYINNGTVFRSHFRYRVPFSSEAEYNAAVGLTNTPIELIELKDFQYLVPESQIIVDKELSENSDNPIANSAVAKVLNNIPQFLTTEEINGIINEVIDEAAEAPSA